MSGRTPINITSQTVYTHVDLTDDLFNVFADASLLLGNDILTDDAIAMSGFARFRAPITIDDGLTLDDTVTLANASVVTQNGSLVLGQSTDDAVTVRNLAGATWILANGTGLSSTGASQFVSQGDLVQTAGISLVDANFVDRGGTIEIGGKLEFQSAANRFVNAEISGPGTFQLSNGVIDGGDVSTVAADLVNVRIVGDVAIGSPNVTIDYLNLAAGAVLDLVPTFVIDGSRATLDLGEIIGPGEIEVGGQEVVATILTLIGGVTFDNKFDSTFENSPPPFGTGVGMQIIATAWAGDQVTIENDADATWTDAGIGATFDSNSGANVTFINNGVFEEFSDLGTTFNMDVVNNGVMEAGPWEVFSVYSPYYQGITLNNAITGNGTIEIGFDSVSANALVGSGQTLEFTTVPSGASAPTLTLNDVQEFSGLISGFDKNAVTDDQIVVNTATLHYQDFVANSGGTGGSLMFTDGSAETAVNLTGTYDPLGFHAAVSGSTTTITYSASP